MKYLAWKYYIHLSPISKIPPKGKNIIRQKSLVNIFARHGVHTIYMYYYVVCRLHVQFEKKWLFKPQCPPHHLTKTTPLFFNTTGPKMWSFYIVKGTFSWDGLDFSWQYTVSVYTRSAACFELLSCIRPFRAYNAKLCLMDLWIRIRNTAYPACWCGFKCSDDS